MRPVIPLVIAGLALGLPGLRAGAGTTDPELGLVRWGHDLGAALGESARGGRPVFLLFDEIPGCATCQGFGQQVLSQPLLVDAIESEFVPVVVHNNRPGADAAVLARYGEPAWNNPVVRFLGADGRDLVPRRDGLYSAHEIARRMAAALSAAHRPVPAYLALTLQETHLATRRTATFAMGCFWEGEARLGALDGVVATRATAIDGREAVEVTYDAAVLPYPRLVEAADRGQCAARVYAADEAERRAASAVVGSRAVSAGAPATNAGAGDQKYYLDHTPLKFVPLTPAQATRANAALHAGGDPLATMSPRQRALAEEIRSGWSRAPEAFAPLARPDDIEALAAYEGSLRAVLHGARAGGARSAAR